LTLTAGEKPMTEAEWLACTDPQIMLGLLRGQASDRKLRLFAVACCRRIWSLLTDERSQRAVAVVEQFAEELTTEMEFEEARWQAVDAYVAPPNPTPYDRALESAAEAACCAGWDDFTPTEQEAQGAATTAAHCCQRAVTHLGGDVDQEKSAQADLLRCILGPNPLGPAPIDPVWLTPIVTSLATAAYQERALHSGELDPARLAVLADALEEAGCSSAPLLGHLRAAGVHVRGCWAVDLLTKRE
jgi:hypothetical protein